MKTILTFVLTLTLSQAFGQVSMGSGPATGAAGGSSTSGSLMNSNTANRPTFGSEVPDRGTTSGDVMRRNPNNTINNTNTTSDTIGTTQSSTTTTNTKRRVIPITPANTNPSGVNCVDRSGRNFGAEDSGYTACVNSMRTR